MNAVLSSGMLKTVRAARMVGATFDQSEDAKQKVELSGQVDSTLEITITEA